MDWWRGRQVQFADRQAGRQVGVVRQLGVARQGAGKQEERREGKAGWQAGMSSGTDVGG